MIVKSPVLLFLFCSQVSADPDCAGFDPNKFSYSDHDSVCRSITLDESYLSEKKKVLSFIDSYLTRDDVDEFAKEELASLREAIERLELTREKYAKEECYISLYGNGGGMESFKYSSCLNSHISHNISLIKRLLEQCERNPPGGQNNICDSF